MKTFILYFKPLWKIRDCPILNAFCSISTYLDLNDISALYLNKLKALRIPTVCTSGNVKCMKDMHFGMQNVLFLDKFYKNIYKVNSISLTKNTVKRY